MGLEVPPAKPDTDQAAVESVIQTTSTGVSIPENVFPNESAVFVLLQIPSWFLIGAAIGLWFVYLTNPLIVTRYLSKVLRWLCRAAVHGALFILDCWIYPAYDWYQLRRDRSDKQVLFGTAVRARRPFGTNAFPAPRTPIWDAVWHRAVGCFWGAVGVVCGVCIPTATATNGFGYVHVVGTSLLALHCLFVELAATAYVSRITRTVRGEPASETNVETLFRNLTPVDFLMMLFVVASLFASITVLTIFFSQYLVVPTSVSFLV